MELEILKDIHTFVTKAVEEPWTPVDSPIYLYHNEQMRLCVIPERNANHTGLWRFDMLAEEHGLYSPALDGQTLGETLVKRVCEYMSVSDMRYMRDALTDAIDRWEKEHHPPR